MATADIALILSHLHLGPRALHPEVRDALVAAASGPPVQIILAGHTLGADLADEQDPGPDLAAQAHLSEGLRLIGRAARGGLTILPGPHEDALLRAETQERLAALCGLQQPEISFGEELLPGLLGRRFQVDADEVFVVSARGLDPLGGLHLPDVLRWSGLRSFVRAYARQMKAASTPPSAETPQHHVAHAMARAVVKLVPGKEEPLLGELGRLAEGHHPEDGPIGELLRLTGDILHESLVERVRHRVGTAVATVVIGAARMGLFDHSKPVLLCTGSASVEHPTWVELPLRGPERPVLRGSGHRPGSAQPVAPLQSAPPRSSAPPETHPPAAASAPVEPSAQVAPSAPPEVSLPAEASVSAEPSPAPQASSSAEPSAPAATGAPAEPSAPVESSAPVEALPPAEAAASSSAPRRDSVAPQPPRGGNQQGVSRQPERPQDRDKRRNKPQPIQQPQKAGGEPQQPPPGGDPPKGSSE